MTGHCSICAIKVRCFANENRFKIAKGQAILKFEQDPKEHF